MRPSEEVKRRPDEQRDKVWVVSAARKYALVYIIAGIRLASSSAC